MDTLASHPSQRPRWLGMSAHAGVLTLLAAFAAGCGDGGSATSGNDASTTISPASTASTGSATNIGPTDATPPPTAASTTSLGTMDVALFGALITQPGIAGRDGSGIDMVPVSIGSVDIGTRNADGQRYLTATYRIRNAQACAAPGTCTPYPFALKNLRFVAVSGTATLVGTPITRLKRFDGTDAASSLATVITPVTGVDGSGNALPAAQSSFRSYGRAGLPAADSGVSVVLPYGFAVAAADGGTTLSGDPAAGTFDGTVSFTWRVPLQPAVADDPFAVAAQFQVVADR